MVLINKIRGKIKECEITQAELAASIGISPSTLSRKLQDGDELTIGEAFKLKNALNMTDEEAISIFFA